MSVTIHVERTTQICVCWEIKGPSLFFVEIFTIWFIMQYTGIQVLTENGRAKTLVPIGQLLTQLELNKDFPRFSQTNMESNVWSACVHRKAGRLLTTVLCAAASCLVTFPSLVCSYVLSLYLSVHCNFCTADIVVLLYTCA